MIAIKCSQQIVSNKYNQFNIPPLHYCSSYTSLPELLLANDEYPYKELLEAAKLEPATCPFTGFKTSTPFIPMAWALRLAATRYPYPAAVTLIKCLRLGVKLGFTGDRTTV